jgi:hypothetical protein
MTKHGTGKIGQSRSAAKMASDQIDQMKDAGATAKENEERKEQLIKGPRGFRQLRKDQHKNSPTDSDDGSV